MPCRFIKRSLDHRRGLIQIWLCVLGLLAANLWPQSISGDVQGTVTDSKSAVIIGARVTIKNINTGALRETKTDDRGMFRIAFLPASTYEIQTEATGFEKAMDSFDLSVGQSRVISPVLKVGGVSQTVIVDGSILPVQLESGELSGVIARRQILELPLNGRNLDQLALLEVGVSSTTNRVITGTIHGKQININGASSRGNRFLLDGTNLGDTFNNGFGSVVGTFLGIDAVEEFRVLTNSYRAEYGQASGGVVSIVSKSGSNDLHISLWEFLRNSKLDARNFFDPEKPGFRRNQFGYSGSGPIIKNRTFLFVSSEWLRDRQGLTRITTVPSLDARGGLLPNPSQPGQFMRININPAAVPYLALFPLPNGRDFGTGLAEFAFPFAQRTNELFSQGRVDHKLNSRNSFFGRYTFDGASTNPPANFPAWAVAETSTNQFVTLEDTHLLSSSDVNMFRFSFSRTNLFSDDQLEQAFPAGSLLIQNRPEPQLSIGGMPTTGSGAPPRSSLQLQNLFSWSDDMSWARGQHILKWGTLLDRTQNLIDTESFLGGLFTFPGILQFLTGSPSSLTIAAPGAHARQYFFDNRFGAYVQDDYKVRPNLTLNVGVRLEFGTVPTEKFGHILGLRDPLHDPGVTVGQLFQNQKQNWAPRIAGAWNPSGDGKTVLRTGFGIFYDINPIPFLAQKINGNPPFNSRLVIGNPGLTPNLSVVPTSIDLGLPAFNWRTPHALQYNAAAEREFFSSAVVTVAYAGARGIDTVRTGEVNSPIPETLADGREYFAPGTPRRNPKIGSITLIRPDGNSRYNALEVKVVLRIGRDLHVQGSYTLSRTIDESQGAISGDALGSLPLAWNPDYRRYDRGLADFDRKHGFVANWIWEMPYLRRQGGVAGAVLSAWEISGILTLLSGNPFTPGIQADWTGTGFAADARGIDRPDVKPGFNSATIVKGGPDQYFDPNAFKLPQKGTFGNLGRNVLIGPGLATVDISTLKNIPVKRFPEGAKLQLRAEAFNLLNRANFNLPNRILFNGVSTTEQPIGSAGRISSTTTSSRQIQVGLRLSW